MSTRKSLIARTILHFLFWICYLGLYTFLGGYSDRDYFNTLTVYMGYLPLIAVSTYIFNYWLVPKFLFRQKYILFAILSCEWIIASVCCMKILYMNLVLLRFFGIAAQRMYFTHGFFYPTYLVNHLISVYTTVLVFGFIKMFRQWYFSNERNLQLAKEKAEAELRFLKAQMNPHFLFNALNNLYALSLKGAPQTPEMILKLASMMEFILYETNSEVIELDKELSLITDYIELEKLRYGSRLSISYSVIDDTSGILCPPLVLFPFIENCFKHGASRDSEAPWIDISLQHNGRFIKFSAINSIPDHQFGIPSFVRKGIGIDNVRQRLNLLFPNNYSLDVTNSENTYTIILELPLIKGNQDENSLSFG
ncbi:MAG: histidine kinase [Ignavibacteria bacterium]|nr:histidine kinase [Ignavibacteria bacterium]